MMCCVLLTTFKKTVVELFSSVRTVTKKIVQKFQK